MDNQEPCEPTPTSATFPVEFGDGCIKLYARTSELTVPDPCLSLDNAAVATQRCDVAKFIALFWMKLIWRWLVRG